MIVSIQSYMLLFIAALLLCLLVASTPGANVDISFGVTQFTHIESRWGTPQSSYWGVYNGNPCLVYVYYNDHANDWTRVYVIDGVIFAIE
jgi:hypothetical protein